MTWIVGNASLFGSAFLVSDIQVTFTDQHGNHSFVDCVQKVYPLGRFVVGGFAGSVRIGFEMLEWLRQIFSQAPATSAWILPDIANDWISSDLSNIFNNSPENEKACGCQIILGAAHPSENRGSVPWAMSHIYRFSWPNFEPETVQGSQTLSIGSGAVVPVYQQAIDGYTSQFHFHQAAMAGPQQQARVLAQHLYETTGRVPQPGISNFFQVAVASRGDAEVVNHELDIYPQNGPKREIRLPPVARSYEEFLAFCAAGGTSAPTAIC